MTNRTFKAGDSREQPSLLPPRIEDYVGPQNPVRAIESFVCALDLAKLGFRHADRTADEVGQPPYDPADLLKLYLYGDINQIRSSRRLEREACRNLELIWLLKNLKPGYRTIANFRKENWAALIRIRGGKRVPRRLGKMARSGSPGRLSPSAATKSWRSRGGPSGRSPGSCAGRRCSWQARSRSPSAPR
jgi:transposase